MQFDPYTPAIALLLILPLLFMIYFEIARYLHIRLIVANFFASRKIPSPVWKLAAYGKLASTSELLLNAYNSEIFDIRTNLASRCHGLYLTHAWSIILSLTPRQWGNGKGKLVVCDEAFAKIILGNPEVWGKRRRKGAVDLLGELACTSMNGEYAKRQRQILIQSMRNRRQYEPHVVRTITYIIKEVQDQMIQQGQDILMINVLPVINDGSLKLLLHTIFGDETPGLDEFCCLFLPYWDNFRSNTQAMNSREQQQRNEKLALDTPLIKQSIWTLVLNRLGLITTKTLIRPSILDHLIKNTDFKYLCNITLKDGQYHAAQAGEVAINKTVFPGPATAARPPHISKEGIMQSTDYMERGPPILSNCSAPTLSKDSIQTAHDNNMLTVDELIHNLHNLILAGFETTAHAVAASLFHLSRSPPYQHLILQQTLSSEKSTAADDGIVVAAVETHRPTDKLAGKFEQLILPSPLSAGCPLSRSADGTSLSRETPSPTDIQTGFATRAATDFDEAMLTSCPQTTTSTTSITSTTSTMSITTTGTTTAVAAATAAATLSVPLAANSTSSKVLTAVVKEALRLHPPVLQMARTSNEETQIGPYTCPKDVTAIIDVVAMHRNRAVWGDFPADFDPCRWLDAQQCDEVNLWFSQATHDDLYSHQHTQYSTGLCCDCLPRSTGTPIWTRTRTDEVDSNMLCVPSFCCSSCSSSSFSGHAGHTVISSVSTSSTTAASTVSSSVSTSTSSSASLDTKRRWWMPFGFGSKSCLGQGFALMVVEQIVAAFVCAFELRPSEGYEPDFQQTPTLRFSNGLQLILIPRGPRVLAEV